MVDGAAGAGKSCTISILKEFVQLILIQSGDNIECPHVLVCAPTGSHTFLILCNIRYELNAGTAAVNINGQTLHSTVGFSFGNEHYYQINREIINEQISRISGF